MKQLVIVSFVLAAFPAFASYTLPAGGYYETRTNHCGPAQMRAALDNATAARRAIITVVKCDSARPAPRAAFEYDVAPRPMPVVAPCDTCGDVVEQVVDRRYYVEETVQQYRPVVHYEPAGEYTRRRSACPSCEM